MMMMMMMMTTTKMMMMEDDGGWYMIGRFTGMGGSERGRSERRTGK